MLDKNVVVIGSGPAGCTAAIYLARAGYRVTQVMGHQVGGQLTTTADVENYPGFDAINGTELIMRMQYQADKYNITKIEDVITSVNFANIPFVIEISNGEKYSYDAVVIATGASAKWLGLDSEREYKNYGVSSCATCDGYFYRGKKVAVVGGGNTAVEEALILANFAESVTLIHRRDELRAEKIIQDRLFSNEKITCIWNSQVVEILGSKNPKHVNGLSLKNLLNGEISKIDVDGVFIAIGHAPQTAPFIGALDLDIGGYIKTEPGSTKTSVKGVFAAGDVQDKIYRQAITAAASGCQAAIDVAHYLGG